MCSLHAKDNLIFDLLPEIKRFFNNLHPIIEFSLLKINKENNSNIMFLSKISPGAAFMLASEWEISEISILNENKKKFVVP